MDSSATWPDDARRRVDEFLDRVERALMSRPISRTERANIVSELATQIDTLVARQVANGVAVTDEVVKDVIESMDPPETYSDSAEPAVSVAPLDARSIQPRLVRRDPVALCAFSLLVYAPLAALLTRGDALFVRSAILAALLACGLGIWSTLRILRSDGWLHGLPLAFAALCGLPVAISQALLFAIANTEVGLALAAALLLVLNVYAHYWVIHYCWRRLSSRYEPRPRPVNGTSASDLGNHAPIGV
jgi:hypothetical protein